MTTNEYFIAWAVYLSATLGFIAAWWSMTSFIRPALLRRTLRMLVLILLVTPYQTYSGQDYLAPAIIIFLFEHFIHQSDSLPRSTLPLVICLSSGMVLVMIYSFFSWQENRHARTPSAKRPRKK